MEFMTQPNLKKNLISKKIIMKGFRHTTSSHVCFFFHAKHARLIYGCLWLCIIDHKMRVQFFPTF